MQTQEVAIKPNLKVVLRSDAQQIDEVVVTAMGIKRSEKALGYAATSVGGEKIAESRTSDVMSSLAGKIAGVQISSTSSDPGASNSVIIRGVSSLSGTNQPLYVVDGVPLNNSTVYSTDGLNSGYDFGNGANAINPDDVANMTILKGAAATALYGSRAANGVVMITTKSGRKEKGVGIEYNGGVQWSTVLRLPEFQNEFGMGWNGNHTELENGSWGPRFDGSMQLWGNVYNNSQKLKPYVAMPDNIKDFFDAGFRYSNSLSFNGATDKSDYYVSFSQISDDGMIPTDADSYDKYTFSARGSHKAGALTFSSSLNYAYQKNNFATTGQGLSMLNSLYQTPRDISIIGLEDQNDPFNTPGYYYTPYGVMNPYYILNNYLNEYESERFYGKFQLDYEFLKYFKFTYRMGLDTTTGQSDKGKPNLYALYYEGTPNGEGQGSSSPFSGETGQYSEQITRRREINQDIMVNFNMPVNDFNINALVGFNGNERKVSYQYSEVNDLTIPTWFNLKNSGKTPIVEQHMELRRLMGVFGQFEGSWKNMLYLTVTARNDWSSTLPSNDKSYFYPSVGVSIIPSNIISLPDWIPFWKLRGSWTVSKTDLAIYDLDRAYTIKQNVWDGLNTASYPDYLRGDVKPITNRTWEIGTGIHFLQGHRLKLDVSYFNKLTYNNTISQRISSATGYKSRLMNIDEEYVRRGVEISIDATPVQVRDFSWDVSLNLSTSKRYYAKLDESFSPDNLWTYVGARTDSYSYKGYDKDPDGNYIINTNGLMSRSQYSSLIGYTDPDLEYGLANVFKYKNFTLTLNFDGRIGGKSWSNTEFHMLETGAHPDTDNQWRYDEVVNGKKNYVGEGVKIVSGEVKYDQYGRITSDTRVFAPNDIETSYEDFVRSSHNNPDKLVQKKTFLKLREMSIGYNLPKKFISKLSMNSCYVGFIGQNLFVLTKDFRFSDPDGFEDIEGEDISSPSIRYVGVNLKVEF